MFVALAAVVTTTVLAPSSPALEPSSANPAIVGLAVGYVGEPPSVEAYDSDPPAFSGRHLEVHVYCPTGYRRTAALSWRAGYDTPVPGDWPTPHTVTRHNLPAAAHTWWVRIPTKVVNGASTAGRMLFLRLECTSASGATQSADSDLLTINRPLSACPEDKHWRPIGPVRVRASARVPVTWAGDGIAVTLTVRNRGMHRWHGNVGFTAAAFTDNPGSLPKLASVTARHMRVVARCLDRGSGYLPRYLVPVAVGAGNKVSIRFHATAGAKVLRVLDRAGLAFWPTRGKQVVGVPAGKYQ